MKAVIYARYSSSHQKEESIEGQLRICKSFAKQQKYQIVDIFIDRALSGKTDARPDFQRMIKLAEAKRFEYIIVYALDRFARNRYDSAIYKNKLKKLGIKVISATENITDEPAGILMESVLEGMAEYYSAELAKKIKRGMTENALAAKWASGHIPFGYQIGSDRKLEINSVKAEMVKKIFNAFIEGQKIVDITKMMNDAHVTTSLGKKWGKNSFHRMLKNEIYIGVFKWSDIRIENAVPAIISEEVFNKAQVILEKHHISNRSGRPSLKYLLSGKLYCGNCGSSMTGVSGHSKQKIRYRYYDCYARRHKNKCDNSPVPADYLENLIYKKTKETLSNPGEIDFIVEQLLNCVQKQLDTTYLEYLREQLKDVNRQIDNIVNIAAQSGILPEPLKIKMNNLVDEQKQLNYDIEKEKLFCQSQLVNEEHIRFFLNDICHASPEKLITTLVNKIIIKKEADGKYTIRIFFNYSPQTPSPDNDGVLKTHRLVEFRGRYENYEVTVNCLCWSVSDKFEHPTKKMH